MMPLQLRQVMDLHSFSRYCSTIIKPSKSSIPEILQNFRDERISEIIDVRTPDEYITDHIPGAINLPVLSNPERVNVGTQYTIDQFRARKMGAAMISRKIAEYIETYFSSKSQDYHPLIYCWRGGQRSYSIGLVLSQIGFQTYVLDGGYKKYRETVIKDLQTLPNNFTYKVISGLTGSGKTHILQELSRQGEQILDLEGLARHKGSILGLWHGETQPSQRQFDTLICEQLHNLSTDKPVWLESESVRIGNIHLPATLFNKLKEAPRYDVVLPLEERVKHIIKDYPNWIEHKDDLKEIMRKLIRVQGHERVNYWLDLIDNNQWEEFVQSILLKHYDPSYTLSQAKNNNSGVADIQVHVSNLEQSTLSQICQELVNG